MVRDLASILNSKQVPYREYSPKTSSQYEVALYIATEKVNFAKSHGVEIVKNFNECNGNSLLEESAIVEYDNTTYLIDFCESEFLRSRNNRGRREYIREKRSKLGYLDENAKVIQFAPFSITGKRDRNFLEKDFKLVKLVDLGY
jgi:hypothetical protein